MRSTFEITLNPLPLFIFKVQGIVLHLENRAFSANFTEFSSHLHSSYLKCKYNKHKQVYIIQQSKARKEFTYFLKYNIQRY